MTETALAGKKILMVEDDPFLHSLLAGEMNKLRAEGVDVHMAMTAEDGLEKVRAVKPDLIMLDLALSGMSGFEFLEQLRKESEIAQTPVVILSNLSTKADQERAKNLGVVGYLVKANNSLGDISDSVRAVLRGETISSPSGADLSVGSTPSGTTIVILK